MYEKISETRSEAVDAMTRLAQRTGANTGYYSLHSTTTAHTKQLLLFFYKLASLSSSLSSSSSYILLKSMVPKYTEQSETMWGFWILIPTLDTTVVASHWRQKQLYILKLLYTLIANNAFNFLKSEIILFVVKATV